VQHERTVNNDNTVEWNNRVLQLNQTRWRDTLAGQTVIVHEHLDGRLSIRYGPPWWRSMRPANCRPKHPAGAERLDCPWAKRRPEKHRKEIFFL
jgi:hypothetical protein